MPERKHKNRISGWLPNQHVWLHDALDDMAAEMSKSGTRTTKADLLLGCLLTEFGHLKPMYEKKETVS